VLRAAVTGERGRNVAHHRYSADFTIEVLEQGEPDTGEALAMPDDLAQSLIAEIKVKAKPRKGDKQYRVVKAEKK
jgi:hypothetical protein